MIGKGALGDLTSQPNVQIQPLRFTTSGTPRENRSQNNKQNALTATTMSHIEPHAAWLGFAAVCVAGPPFEWNSSMEPSTKGSMTPGSCPIVFVIEYIKLAMLGSGAMSM